MGYLRKNGDGSLLYSVVNTAEPDADGEWALEGLGFSEAHMLLSPISALPGVLFEISVSPAERGTHGRT